MNPSQIYDILDLAMRARQKDQIYNPLFVSPPGIGKSSIVQAWANKNEIPFIDIRAAYLEPPDLIGYPSIENRNGRQITVHNLPEFLPEDNNKAGVLLIEEPNRANTSMMNCLMQLLTDRKIHKYTLPKNWIIVGCINPEGDEYDVNRMDAALRDRFEIFNVTYDKQSFVKYMKSADWNRDLMNFVESGIWSYTPPENINNLPGAKYISPRSLSKINAALTAGFDKDLELTLWETTLGLNVAKDFYNFRHNESPVMYNDLKTNLKASLKKLEKFSDPNDYKNGMISLTVKDIIEHVDIDDKTLAAVLLNIPVEQGTVLVRELEYKRKDDKLLSRLFDDYPAVKTLLKTVIKYK